MIYLVDTDLIASYLNGHKKAVTVLDKLAGQGLAISLMTFGEIYEGIYFSKDPKVAEQVFLKLLHGLTVQPLSKNVLRQFARIRGGLRAKRILIPDTDLLIAATAIYYNLILVTGNIRHFNRVPNLNLYQQSLETI